MAGNVSMTVQEEKEFEALITALAKDPRTQRMRKYIQHGSVTTYEHCMRVAKRAFVLNRRLHIHANERHLVTAAFLHDYYLYDWHGHGDHLHGYHHPRLAAINAERDFNISDETRRAIETHMWPLTFFHAPNSRIGWLVTVSDKICSSQETLFERKGTVM